MLQRRDIELQVAWSADEADDPGAGRLAGELGLLAGDDSLLLCVLGESYGVPVELLPPGLERGFPHLVPYQGSSRTELLSRHALAAAETGRMIFVLRVDPPGAATSPSPRADALMRTVRASHAIVLESERVDRAVPTPAARAGNGHQPGTNTDDFGEDVLTALWQAVLEREAGLPAAAEAGQVDENVQFTVYRPRAVRPQHWYDMLVFAHLAERRPDARADELDPLVRVRAEAAQILGAQLPGYDDPRSDSRHAVPREGEITLLPLVPGVRFNPERRTFRWEEEVHREQFRLQASAELAGRTARGRLSVYLGAIILAEVDLAFRAESDAALPTAQVGEPAEQARPYRKIFASYSHADAEIVRQFELLAGSFGDEYLRDVVRLRAGSDWDSELLKLIEQADIFQLFWSSNSMRSEQVQREWQHALSLSRPNFVRPTYWEDPLPSSEQPPLPPDSLRRLHFHRIAALPAARTRTITGPPEPAMQPYSPPTRPAAEPLLAAKSARPGSTTPASAAPAMTAPGSPGAPAKRGRFRARTLIAPLAVLVLGAGTVTTVLTANQSQQNGSTNEPTASVSQAPEPTTSGRPSAGQSGTPSGSPSRPAALYSMRVTGGTLVSGPKESHPGGAGATYRVAAGARLTAVLRFTNSRAVTSRIDVRAEVSCQGANGKTVDGGASETTVSVTGDQASKRGRVPTTVVTSPALAAPTGCASPLGSRPNGTVVVTAGEPGGQPTTISASLVIG